MLPCSCYQHKRLAAPTTWGQQAGHQKQIQVQRLERTALHLT